jgi:hypothetical protein
LEEPLHVTNLRAQPSQAATLQADEGLANIDQSRG